MLGKSKQKGPIKDDAERIQTYCKFTMSQYFILRMFDYSSGRRGGMIATHAACRTQVFSEDMDDEKLEFVMATTKVFLRFFKCVWFVGN